ncbi:hypothetical protein [Gemmobacter fulvus]|uniref:hypothetical protein n=1 Tax=Gemmobacter fulvus TaxID=2840474 RepID=UPI0027B9DBB2|nr:hypothetical protein [Gemmobacter fulvus]
MNMTWLLRMARWARNPPSPARVKLVLGVVAACLILAGIEWIWGWPEALTPTKIPRKP